MNRNFKLFIALISLIIFGATGSSFASSQSENIAKKGGFYIAQDILYSAVDHSYHYYCCNELNNVSVKDKKSGNFSTSFSAGYKIPFGKFFITPEIFYDHLNNRADDFFVPDIDKTSLKSRYGAKLYAGYNIFSKLNVFTSIGYANIRTHITNKASINPYSPNLSSNQQSFVYGFGAAYDFSEHWGARLIYDQQRIIIPYGTNADSSLEVHSFLRTFKAGIVYKF